MRRLHKYLKQYQRQDFIVLFLIACLGLGFRLYPGKDHFLWVYDHARDAYRSRSIITEKNVALVGPQTDYPGLNHGPLSYYFFAPFYFLSHGDPNLPGLAMILLNLSGMIPVFLLTEVLFRKRSLSYMATLFYAISYYVVEYGRWIFNFSLSLPLLGWSYYFLWQTIHQKKYPAWTGLTLALAIQGELYLLYLIPFYYAFFLTNKASRTVWLRFHLGLLLGGFTFILAEIKFRFLGTKTFLIDFLGGHKEIIDAPVAVNNYLSHMGETVKHTIGGLSYPMGLLIFVCLLGWMWTHYSGFNKHIKQAVTFLVVLLLSHSVLFTFHAPLKVFLNFSIVIPLLILAAFAIYHLWEKKQKIIAATLFALFVFFAAYQLHTNTVRQTPFEGFNFVQSYELFSQKLEIVDAMYELAGTDQPFSMSVLGTPFGVQTVWASVFEQHHRRHNLPLPVWYGERALGYPNDQFFPKVDELTPNHILIIESSQFLISDHTKDSFMEDQNRLSTLEKEVILYDYRIQLRHPKSTMIQSQSNL
jgi:hypothetical protein